MCGIVGIVARQPVNQLLYDALITLQHRGQDAAGIATSAGGHLFLRKNTGLTRDVFHLRHMFRLRGNLGIGHVRYPTAGRSSAAEAQPFYVNSPYGIALAHNGNLVNVEELKRDLFRDDLRHLNTDSDSEVLLNVFAHELFASGRGKLRINATDVFDAVRRVHGRIRGAYAVVALITGYGIVAFRDPYGIRPLVFGSRETPEGKEWIISSESVAIDALGYQTVRDVQPGEAVFVTTDGEFHACQCAEHPVTTPCIFEHVYFARPDSIIDGISVYKARLRMGVNLAQKILRLRPEHDIDVVIPIPDTSRTAALQLAYELGVVYREGFIKNRYIGRTFIMPGQDERSRSVRQKLNAIGLEFRGKNVMLVDDSIVRGTTRAQIIQMARDAGARKVFFASAAPPVRYPNVYGIDMPSSEELVAHGRTEEEVATLIQADWLVYQDLEGLVSAVGRGNSAIQRFDTSCFTGDYVTGDVTAEYLANLSVIRSDSAKRQREGICKVNCLSPHHDDG